MKEEGYNSILITASNKVKIKEDVSIVVWSMKGQYNTKILQEISHLGKCPIEAEMLNTQIISRLGEDHEDLREMDQLEESLSIVRCLHKLEVTCQEAQENH